jgi:hypothetical protein
MEIETLLETASDPDWWEIRIRTDADGEIELEMQARYFNSIVGFVPPSEDTSWRWLGTWEQINPDDSVDEHLVGEVSVPQIIDVVPAYAEPMVLEVTRHTAEFLVAGEDEQEQQRGLKLLSEIEQGAAHSKHWREKAENRYGNLILYELPADVEIRWLVGEESGQPAIFAHTEEFDRDGEASMVLISPDTKLRWRRGHPGRAHEAGEYLPVHDVLARVGDQHHAWVREQTGLALGDTLKRIRELVSQPEAGQAEPTVIEELALATAHALYLAEGVRAEQFRT